jgi:CIC family chloride channel protein
VAFWHRLREICWTFYRTAQAKARAVGRASHPHRAGVTTILLALLAGPTVGLVVAFLNWSTSNLARFVLMLSNDSPSFGPAVDYMLTLLIGALIMGFLLNLSPYAGGPGIGDAVCIITNKHGQGPWHWLPLKLLGTIICVGTGGGGLVGPSYFIGTAVGVVLTRLLRLRDQSWSQLLALVGGAAGVGAALRSPIGGMLVCMEALRNKDSKLVLSRGVGCLIASLGAYLTLGTLVGFSPLLRLEVPTVMTWSLALLARVGFAALVSGVAAKAYIELVRGVGQLFRRREMPLWTRPALGALSAGPVIIFLSTGASSALQPFEIGRPGLAPLQDALLGRLWLAVLLSLTVGKAVDVALRSGSGGSVGIFGPAMWVGGLTGAMAGFLPGSQSTPLLVGTGIAAGIAAAMEFPLAAAVIVIEILGRGMIVPSVVGSVMGVVAWRGWNRLFRRANQV